MILDFKNIDLDLEFKMYYGRFLERHVEGTGTRLRQAQQLIEFHKIVVLTQSEVVLFTSEKDLNISSTF